MGKALIRMHVLRLFAECYTVWKNQNLQLDEERQILVPLKYLRMAHEIIEEEKLKVEKGL